MIPPQGSKTKQGYELQLGTNNLGAFLFTKILHPSSPGQERPHLRIVCVLFGYRPVPPSCWHRRAELISVICKAYFEFEESSKESHIALHFKEGLMSAFTFLILHFFSSEQGHTNVF